MSAKQKYLDAGHNTEEINSDKEVEFLQEDTKSLAGLPTLVSSIMDVLTSLSERVDSTTISNESTVPLAPSPIIRGVDSLDSHMAPALGVTERKFLDGLKGAVVSEFKILNPAYEELNSDWTSTPLVVTVECGSSVDLKDYATKSEKWYQGSYTKNQRAAVPKPVCGSKFKTDKEYIDFIRLHLIRHVSAGGSASLLSTLGSGFENFAAAVRLDTLDLGTITMKEIIAIVLFVKWRPLEYEEAFKALGELSLDFYSYDKIIDTVNSYISSVKKTVMNRTFTKKLVEKLILKWGPEFVKWKSHVEEHISNGSMDSWEQLYAYLELKAGQADKASKSGSVLNREARRPDKPVKVAATTPGSTPGKKSNSVPAPTSGPKLGLECPGCKRKLTNLESPDFKLFQTRGWPTTADGTKIECDHVTDKAAMDRWIQKRKQLTAKNLAKKEE